MQRIERYGVIALVFLLVTILAVSLWGEHEGRSVFSFLRRKGSAEPELAAARPGSAIDPGAVAAERDIASRLLPLSQSSPPPAMASSPSGGASSSAAQQIAEPPAGAGLAASGAPAGGFRAWPGSSSDAPIVAPAEIGSAPPPRTAPATRSLAPPPSASPPPSAAQPAAGSRTYVVKPGETLGEIAQRELGTFRRWTEIQRLNGNLAPSALRAGMKLRLPAAGTDTVPGNAKPAATPPASGGASYVVRSGDTLSGVASRTLGDASRWREIAALNPGVDPNRLIVGARLRVPGAAREAAAASESPVVSWSPRSAVASSAKGGQVR
ncbi:MAG TPA: LysM domain-containing protein [Planctomycetota bacterium]|nr:LysM domain-containing protein [Planctomycetota bacterium]